MDLKVQGEVLRETHARMTEERNTGGSGGDREKLAWKIKEGRWWRWGGRNGTQWRRRNREWIRKQKWRAKRAQSVSDKETFSSKVTDSSKCPAKCVLHWNSTAQPISGGKITGPNPPAARGSTRSPVAFYQFGRIRNYFPELKTDAFLHISYHKCIQLRYNIL